MPPKPPLANTVKLEVNWANSLGRPAHNIAYAQFAGSVDTSSPTLLGQVAAALFSAFTTGSPHIMSQLSAQWNLVSVTCSDNSGASDAQATTTSSPFAGASSGPSLPPQCAVCISWDIAARYRGGKPRWYLPGVPNTAQTETDDSGLSSTFATAVEQGANQLESQFNASSPGGNDIILGTISYFTGKAPRVTPLFRPFAAARVHERLDSQRRRSGKESAFGFVGT